jgi:hypothetical protein
MGFSGLVGIKKDYLAIPAEVSVERPFSAASDDALILSRTIYAPILIRTMP